jgi:hypothetical protein
VTWIVSRNGREVELQQPALSREIALRLARDVAVTQDEESTTLVLTPNAPAAGQGMQDGDRALRIDKVAVSAWKELQEITRSAAKEDRALRFTVERRSDGGEAAGQIHEIEARAQPWSPPYYGFSLQDDQYVYEAPSAAAALRIGFKARCRRCPTCGACSSASRRATSPARTSAASSPSARCPTASPPRAWRSSCSSSASSASTSRSSTSCRSPCSTAGTSCSC